MSQKVSGVVKKVWVKQFDGRDGRKGNTWYSIELLDQLKFFYRCKAINPGDLDGKAIEFEFTDLNEAKHEAQVVTSSIKVIEPRKQASPAQSAASPAAAAITSAYGQGRESYIHYQSARKDALQFVDIATRLSALTLPAKQANKLQALEALVDHYTAGYFEDISTHGAVARANGTAAPAEETAAQTSDEE